MFLASERVRFVALVPPSLLVLVDDESVSDTSRRYIAMKENFDRRFRFLPWSTCCRREFVLARVRGFTRSHWPVIFYTGLVEIVLRTGSAVFLGERNVGKCFC